MKKEISKKKRLREVRGNNYKRKSKC